MEMEITDQLLAAYVEGNVSDSERDAVRHYLTDNPAELETVTMMMDEDYDLDLDDVDDDTISDSVGGESTFSDLCYSAAAFAPRIMSFKKFSNSPPKIEKSNFSQRLDDLIDDIF